MVFGVKDTAALDKLKPGDRIRFRAEMDGTSYVVTRIEK
jgi:Cu/Ag efflux protein CusF